MPAVYELFVLSKNSLSAAALKTLMRNTGRMILDERVHAEADRGVGASSSPSSLSSSSTPSSTSSSPPGSSVSPPKRGGVIMDVKYFGEQDLAYTIRRPGERHDSALVWQMTFGCESSRVAEIERGLRLDEGVVRWSVLRRRYPYGENVRMSSYKVAERARELMAEEARGE